MFRRFLWTAAVAAITALVAPATSQATFSVSIDTGSGFGTPITDSLTGTDPGVSGQLYDSNSGAGWIDVAQSGSTPPTLVNLDGFTLQVTARTVDSPFLGKVLDQSLQILNNDSVERVIKIQVQNDAMSNFIPATGDVYFDNRLTVLTVVGGSGGGTLAGGGVASVTSWGFGASPAITSSVSANNLNDGDFGAFPASTLVWNKSGNPYSLTNTVEVHLAAGAEIDFQALVQITPAPAPTGLILAATALPFVGMLRRRLRAAAPTV